MPILRGMASDTFFFQDDIYPKKRLNFFGTKKKNANSSAFAVSAYINSLPASWFDDNNLVRQPKSYAKRKGVRLPSISLNIQLKNMLIVVSSLCLCALVSFLIYFSLTPSSILQKIELKDDAKSEHFMHLLVMSYMEEPDGIRAKIPQIIKEVTYKDYVVRQGDTISGIAYKMGLRNIGTIFSANNITNARRIMSGTRLIIPSIDGVVYVVKKGDSIKSIAKHFEVSIEGLLDANDISDEQISEGEKLFIPGASLSKEQIRKAMGELFIYPIRGGRLTSPFGYRKDPFTGRKSFHSGIDLAAPEGTPVKVILDGTISEVSYSRVFGNYIIVRHDNGYQTLYGHLSAFKAKKGEAVEQGRVIALVGNTGMSTGPHVHLSIYKNGKLLDPLTLLK